MRNVSCAVLALMLSLGALALSGGSDRAFAEAARKRVLFFHSFGRDMGPWSEYSRHLRAEIERQSPQPIDIDEASLATSRSAVVEGPFIDYIQALFAGRRPELIIAIGGPAAAFMQQHRDKLFPDSPLLMAALDHRRVANLALRGNDTFATVRIDIAAVIDNVIRLQPNVDNMMLVTGASPIERYWREQFRADVEPYTKSIAFSYVTDLSFPQILEKARQLPPRSALIFGTMVVDAAGTPHEEGRAIASLREVSGAPMYSYVDAFLGMGIVGGPMLAMQQVATATANTAVRILGGASPADLRPAPSNFAAPKYDWREMQRWSIAENRLPAGSEVLYRPLSLWDQYRWQLIATMVAVVLQSLMISGLLFERYRRQRAEVESRGRLLEVMHLSRAATAGAMSASIAHELNQPLGAILSNTETAEILVSSKTPDIAQLKEILADIRHADHRAADIIRHLRGLLTKKGEMELQVFDLKDVIKASLQILGPEAAKRQVTLGSDLTESVLPVRSDPVHLQQVILNLALNGMDAMQDSSGVRKLTIDAALNKDGNAEISVTDTGSGIPPDKLNSIFETFYTTKRHGIGLGLSITRTIVETYGGEVWAQNIPQGGAVFRFTLPLAAARVAA